MSVGEQPLEGMTTCLAHRGPDGDGFFRQGPVGLGHRRLAIIDLATGDQPMSNDDRSVTLVFNGEIYNFRELRRELEARGRHFRTASDSEVILRAYEEFGVECLRHLRGMFAFAIWDERRRRLFLARDRVGIKPLVYAWDGRRLLFASEIKAILQDPDVPRRLDWEALRDYLTLHYIPSPRTIFEGIRKLPPACLPHAGSRWRGAARSSGTGICASSRTTGGATPSGWRGCGLISRMRYGATWSATCRSAPSSVAEWTRARWWPSWPAPPRGKCAPSRSASTRPTSTSWRTRGGWPAVTTPSTSSSW